MMNFRHRCTLTKLFFSLLTFIIGRYLPYYNYITLLFSSLPIGAFQWPIALSIMLTITWTIYLYNNCDIPFLTVFILTHPANLPSGRKSEHSEKNHNFQ
jgi:hypothetical protein